MINISRSKHSEDPIFGMHIDILTNLRRTGNNLQLGPLWRKYSDLIEELAPKVVCSSFQKSPFGLTQTTKTISGRMKYYKF